MDRASESVPKVSISVRLGCGRNLLLQAFLTARDSTRAAMDRGENVWFKSEVHR